MTLRKVSLALAFLFCITVGSALAQGPMQTRINFTVNGPFELKGTSVVLPGGDYVLFQIVPNDRHLFALYQGSDLTHTPVAMIRTVRIYHDLGMLPDRTDMLMETDEGSPQNYPVLEGWNVPGDYGWEVISVTTNRNALSRYQTGR
ncbi:MAG: hypothetical protein WAV20_10950 [Blastocatellia bacterium]